MRAHGVRVAAGVSAGVLCGGDLRAHAADREHVSAQCHLACHRRVRARQPAAEQREERTRDREARGWPVLLDRPRGEVHVQVEPAEQARLTARLGRADLAAAAAALAAIAAAWREA